MEKYKPGDIVRVRRDLHLGQCGYDLVVQPMLKYRGKKLKVLGIYLDGAYKLNDKEGWYWTNEMLERYNKGPKKNKPQIIVDEGDSKDFLKQSLKLDMEHCEIDGFELKEIESNYLKRKEGTITFTLTYKKGDNQMANKDGTGPRSGSTGPRDGRGNGAGRAGGKGTGKKTGGKKGNC